MDAAVAVITTHYDVVTLVAAQNNSFRDVFLPSFLAILLAGFIITICNILFLKAERRHRIADSFCVHLEKLIIKYFNETDEKNKMILLGEFHAYLRSFILFVERNDSIPKNPEITEQWNILLDLDLATVETKKKGMAQAMVAVAMLRHLIAE